MHVMEIQVLRIVSGGHLEFIEPKNIISATSSWANNSSEEKCLSSCDHKHKFIKLKSVQRHYSKPVMNAQNEALLGK